jgi:hypothetical protein
MKTKLSTLIASMLFTVGVLAQPVAATNIIGSRIWVTNQMFMYTNHMLAITNMQSSNSVWRAELNTGGKLPIPRSAITNMIQSMIASGEFCDMNGKHLWIPHVDTHLVYYPDGPPEFRECIVCKKIEARVKTDWH